MDGFILSIENRIMRFIWSIVDSDKMVMYLGDVFVPMTYWFSYLLLIVSLTLN